MKLGFLEAKDSITSSFDKILWDAQSGISDDSLRSLVSKIEGAYASKATVRAKTFELILTKAQLSVNPNDIFQEKIAGYSIMAQQRGRFNKAITDAYLREETIAAERGWQEFGTYGAYGDYGHVSPNTRLLLSVGFQGLLDRIEKASARQGLSEKQREFYESCRIVLNAQMAAASRLGEAIAPYNAENAEALRSIAKGAPSNIYEAMQLLILYFFTHEFNGGARVRTLGRLDVLLAPFYENDIRNANFSKAQIKEMLKYFLYKLWAAKVPFDLPFCLCGLNEDGTDASSDITYLIIDAYNELNIHSPKIHIRVSKNTPKALVKKVLDCIRRGNSSFVFINDKIAMESLVRVGISESDAWDYVPIGCYEPAVWGVELGCTGNGGVNLPKAIELVICGGRDHKSGELCGVEMDLPKSYEDFIRAVKLQIEKMAKDATDYITAIERYYGEIYPDPILSAQYDHSVELGVDVYEGGAKYNNSSLYFYSIASLVDSLWAIKALVYDKKRLTIEELAEALKADWQGFEKERLLALRLPEKYGNGNAYADSLARELAHFCAGLVNNKKNSRGGVFKAAFFTINYCFPLGQKTMATPDGRRRGDPLSKNLCACLGMDKNGITALINSVTSMDLAEFPTGSVLDIVLHPSAVSGEDGLESFYGILTTYFKKGGSALHGNIFDAEVLKKAQSNPLQYQNLQVRVCGWNAYFVNLSKSEQDCFIRQAEQNA